MRRFLFNIAAIFSLLLLAATAVLWVRSYWRIDGVRFDGVDVAADGEPRQSIDFVATYPAVVCISWSSWPASQNRSTGQTGAQIFGYRVQPLSRPLYAKATWDSGFMQNFFRWKFLRMAWWKTGRLPLPSGSYQENWAIIIPDWLLAALLMILPALWFRDLHNHRRLRQRLQNNHCIKCNYNLAANISGVCPECGTKVTA